MKKLFVFLLMTTTLLSFAGTRKNKKKIKRTVRKMERAIDKAETADELKTDVEGYIESLLEKIDRSDFSNIQAVALIENCQEDFIRDASVDYNNPTAKAVDAWLLADSAVECLKEARRLLSL